MAKSQMAPDPTPDEIERMKVLIRDEWVHPKKHKHCRVIGTAEAAIRQPGIRQCKVGTAE